MKKTKFLVVLLLLFLRSGFSQTLGFIGPNGGPMSYVNVMPGGPVFITDGFVLYRSTNNGNSWQSIFNEDNGISIIKSSQPGTVFLGSGDLESIIFRSTDNGQTFTQIVTLERRLTSIDIAPNGSIFASTYYVFSFHGNTVQEGEIHFSVDNGNSWQPSNFPLLAVNDMKVNSNGIIAAATVLDGILISNNMGSSWSLSAPDTAAVLGKTSNGNFYAGVRSGIKRSVNNGQSWNPVNNGLVNGGQYPNAIIEASPGILYCVIGKKIFRSSNYGDNWNLINSPDSSSPNQYINMMGARTTGELFTATGLGAYRSTNNGSLWTAINQGIEAVAARAVLALEAGRVITSSFTTSFNTTNNGLNWSTFLIDGETASFNRIKKKNNVIYLNVPQKGLFISSNNGANWSNITGGITFNSEFDAGTNSTIYLCTSDSGVIRSTNNGANWNHITNGLPAEGDALSVMVDNLNNAYVVITPFTFPIVYEVYRSTNNGNNWSKIQNDLRLTFRGVNSSNNLFASIDDEQNPNTNQLYRSTNSGANWQLLNSLTGFITAFTISGNNTIYAATSEAFPPIYNLHKSTDNGQTFNIVNTGIGNIKINALSINQDGKLYAATNKGVYAEGVVSSSPGAQTSNPEKFRLFQNFPNPFNPVTRISFEIPDNSNVSLKVYDISGRQISTLLSGPMNKGLHTVDFDAGNFSSGIYLYVLESGDVYIARKMLLVK
jgi:photosystem II stability/assembly factor-like uncharacterized protein